MASGARGAHVLSRDMPDTDLPVLAELPDGTELTTVPARPREDWAPAAG
jgi:hypothetical protein